MHKHGPGPTLTELRAADRLVQAAPRRGVSRGDCEFYHTFEFPDGETAIGPWDLRGRFEQYIGNVSVLGRSVFDVGTASGFLAFSAEAAGASEVMACDVRSLYDQTRVPFQNSEYSLSKRKWAERHDAGLERTKNGFWYAWEKFRSRVNVAYASIDDLCSAEDRFDVVIAGALIEHVSDPVTAIGALSRLARETVVIAFTPVDMMSNECRLTPLVPWTPEVDYVWWVASRGLYEQVFAGLGFAVRFAPCTALRNEAGRVYTVPRHTIVAERSR